MSVREYIESEPLRELVRSGRRDALNALPFVGTLRKHPYDAEKCLLLTGRQERLPWVEEGQIFEFRIADVLGADELPALVDEAGSARPLLRLWVRRGALALRYEPFEVGDRPLGARESAVLRAKLAQSTR